jgi:hypothetical protein
MNELIKYRNEINDKKNADCAFSHFLINHRSFKFNNRIDSKFKDFGDIELYFKDIEDQFYKEYPQQIFNESISSLKEEFKIVNSKLKTIEQFQAQIIDKLSVFAEMIDDIQNSLKT